MNLNNLISSGNNFQIVVSAADLKEFALSIMAEVRAEQQPNNNEVYYSVEETAKMFGIDKSTLWRWEKNCYLVPIRIGRKPKYRKSDIDALMEG